MSVAETLRIGLTALFVIGIVLFITVPTLLRLWMGAVDDAKEDWALLREMGEAIGIALVGIVSVTVLAYAVGKLVEVVVF